MPLTRQRLYRHGKIFARRRKWIEFIFAFGRANNIEIPLRKGETILGTKHEEADLILKLYETRRDEESRKARKWYDTEFDPQSAQDIVDLLTGDFAESAYFRQVTSYWEMVAAFVNRGAISPDLLHATNVEHFRVYAKIEPFVEEIRAKFGPDFLPELEKAVKTATDYEKKLEGWRELNKNWTRGNKTKNRKTKK